MTFILLALLTVVKADKMDISVSACKEHCDNKPDGVQCLNHSAGNRNGANMFACGIHRKCRNDCERQLKK